MTWKIPSCRTRARTALGLTGGLFLGAPEIDGVTLSSSWRAPPRVRAVPPGRARTLQGSGLPDDPKAGRVLVRENHLQDRQIVEIVGGAQRPGARRVGHVPPGGSHSHATMNLTSALILRFADKLMNGTFYKKLAQLLTEGLVLGKRRWLQGDEPIVCSHLKMISWPFAK